MHDQMAGCPLVMRIFKHVIESWTSPGGGHDLGDHGGTRAARPVRMIQGKDNAAGKESGVIGDLQCLVIDCPDALGLAEFYRALLGGAVNQPDPRWAVSEHFATLHTEGRLVLAFQRAADYVPPQWPDHAHPQQFHLDIDVQDVDQAQAQALHFGAVLLHIDPRGWRIFADPAGHPFCLLTRRPVAGKDRPSA
jgi:hypothetical protein